LEEFLLNLQRHTSIRIAVFMAISAAAFPAIAQVGGKPLRNDANLIGRSDIVLARPNFEANQAMPLGNGRLGAAAWAADGLTVQLNRGDTLPELLPVARVSLPGLTGMTAADDYAGRLSLYDGEFYEQGAGIRAQVYVDTATDALMIDVTGADPAKQQTAKLFVPAPQKPTAQADGSIGIVSRAWKDDKQPGSSGRAFGALAAVTAQGREVSAAKVDGNMVAVSFRPFADGHFRVVVAAPHFNAEAGAPAVVARQSLSKITGKDAADRSWWHQFWQRAAPMKIASPDGSGEYMENLRALCLYSAASESGGEFPGSQAGVADLLGSALMHNWDPAAYWHWNLRMQVAANLSAGVPELNAPYFTLYKGSLSGIESWTKEHMKGLPGICIPETMRFNGPGIEYETWNPKEPVIGMNCDAGSKPYYNARTISTGAEVSLWIWQQYLATNDRAFLARNFPVMAAAARFLLAYETNGQDGLRHTVPTNAHETQWDTEDSTIDLAARMAFFQAAADAAKILGTEPALAAQLRAELGKIPPFPRTEAKSAKTLLAGNSGAGDDVIADSYHPADENHNVENIGLEPVWPFGVIGDTSPLFALAQRTFEHRPYPTNQDWSFDPIQAARLHLPDEVRATLVKLTETYQTFINGYANWGGKTGEFYLEQQGVVAAALDEALVQDYDGLIRIDPAFPKEWDVDGQVAVRGKSRVDVSIRGGKVVRVIVEAGSNGPVKLRNPWGESTVEIVAGGRVAKRLEGGTLEFPVVAGHAYRVNLAGQGMADSSPIPEAPARSAKKLGPVQIGIFPAAR
jgi:alpha-L-fucosidase 2